MWERLFPIECRTNQYKGVNIRQDERETIKYT